MAQGNKEDLMRFLEEFYAALLERPQGEWQGHLNKARRVFSRQRRTPWFETIESFLKEAKWRLTFPRPAQSPSADTRTLPRPAQEPPKTA